MKRKLFLLSVLSAALAASVSCQKDSGMEEPLVEYDRVVFSVDDYDFRDDVPTKLTPSVSSSGVSYLWAQGDTVGIYPDAGSQLVFPVSDYGRTTSSFDGGAWKLSSDHVYYAYVPFVPDIRLDRRHIPVSFRGQRQEADADATGLRDYVFMSASGAAPVGKDLMFQFKRLGCLLWISLDLDGINAYSSEDTFKSLRVYLSDGSNLPVDGEFDLMATTADAAPDLNITRYEDSWTLDLSEIDLRQLAEVSDGRIVGMNPLTCYMMVPPVDLTGKTVKFELTYTQDLDLMTAVFTADGKNLRKSGATRFAPSRMENIISFEEKVVHDLCVARWDTNGNGELEYSEAEAVTEIPPVMFIGRNIKYFDELRYFTSLTKIGDGAFSENPNLRRIMLPSGNTFHIGTCAFSGCNSLESVGSNSLSISYLGTEAFDGCLLYDTKIILTEDVVQIPDSAFRNCRGLREINIPQSVKYIGSHAFDGCQSLSAISLPDNVDVGPYGVFAGTNIRSISIPSSWTEIGDGFFSGCRYLSGITIPEGITRIGDRAFLQCYALTSVSLPESLLTIGGECFRGCLSLESIVIPSKITHLSDMTFYECSKLSDVTLPEGLVSISSSGNGAFTGCRSLESITLPSTLSSIGEYTFFASGLRSIVLPDNVRYLGKGAFERCSNLTECTLSQNLTSLDEGLFTYNGITALTIPSKVAVIRSDLSKMGNLEELVLLSTTPPSIPNADMIPYDCSIHVPDSSVNTYKTAPFWREHAEQILSIPGGGAGGDTGGPDNWD